MDTPKKLPVANGPVGDIVLKKDAKSCNTYTLKLSYGQITAIHAALSKDHANPVADELVTLFSYYIDKVPGPGETDDDLKKRSDADDLNKPEDDDFPVPMPPGYEGDGRTTVAGEGEEGAEGETDTAYDDAASEDLNKPAPRYSDNSEGSEEQSDADKRVPAPPSDE